MTPVVDPEPRLLLTGIEEATLYHDPVSRVSLVSFGVIRLRTPD